MTKRIHIASPCVGEEEWQATKEVFESGWITQGPKVAEMEKIFSEIHNLKHSIAVTSCTTGLHLALATMGIGPGDEVIVPSFTWVATANVVKHLGATPVLADVDPLTNNIKIEGLSKLRTDKTKAIIPVHLFGLCADIDGIRKVLPGLFILEDAACAAGAMYDDTRYAGSLGDAASFSLHPRKAVTTGEGGLLTTNNDEIADLASKLRNHGAEISEEQRHLGPKPFLLPDFNYFGFNYRMTDIQGAVGIVQLRKLNDFISFRDEWANFYKEELKDIPWLTLPHFPEKGRHAWQSFVLLIDEEKSPYSRNEIMERLQSKGVDTRPGTHAIHLLNAYKNEYGFKPEDFPGALKCATQTMSIPFHNKMNKEDYHYVVKALKEL